MAIAADFKLLRSPTDDSPCCDHGRGCGLHWCKRDQDHGADPESADLAVVPETASTSAVYAGEAVESTAIADAIQCFDTSLRRR